MWGVPNILSVRVQNFVKKIDVLSDCLALYNCWVAMFGSVFFCVLFSGGDDSDGDDSHKKIRK